MKELWTYEGFGVESSGVDLTGWDAYARDDHLGKIDEASYETGHSYLVVDTGFWIFGKKRMIPAGSIDRIDPQQRAVYVALSKEEVKQAPDYDEVKRDDNAFAERHTDYYTEFYGRGPRATLAAAERRGA